MAETISKEYIGYIYVPILKPMDYTPLPVGRTREEHRDIVMRERAGNLKHACMLSVKGEGGTIVNWFEEKEVRDSKNRKGMEDAVRECKRYNCHLVVSIPDKIMMDMFKIFMERSGMDKFNLEVLIAETSTADKTISEMEILGKKKKARKKSYKPNKRKYTGKKIGNPNFYSTEYHKKHKSNKLKGVASFMRRARENPENIKSYAYITKCLESGIKSWSKIANEMSAAGYVTSRGIPMHRRAAMRIYEMYKKATVDDIPKFE